MHRVLPMLHTRPLYGLGAFGRGWLCLAFRDTPREHFAQVKIFVSHLGPFNCFTLEVCIPHSLILYT